jgi:hypothetical protein
MSDEYSRPTADRLWLACAELGLVDAFGGAEYQRRFADPAEVERWARAALPVTGGYEGWTNHETWHTAHVINNDQPTQEYAHALSRQAIESAPQDPYVAKGTWTVERAERYRLADALRAWVERELPDLENMGDTAGRYHAQGYIRDGFDAVDWVQLAETLLSDVREVS